MIEKTFNTGTVNLNYVESSPGGTPLLLLHGLAARWQSFYNLIPELEKQWHLYALDLRGRGKSGRAGSYRIQDHIPDIESFIKNCIKEPAIIFGHSFGGMIGIMVAAYNPELVKALIIGDSIISLEFLKQCSEGHRNTTIFWRDLAKNKSVEFIISELKKQLIPVPNQEEPVPAYKVYGEDNPYFQHMAATFSQLDPEILTADIDHFDETYADYQTDRLFPKIQCPVLLLQANPELGGLMRDEDVKKALSLLPKTHHVKINNVGHYLHLQDKESVLNAVVPFIESLALHGA